MLSPNCRIPVFSRDEKNWFIFGPVAGELGAIKSRAGGDTFAVIADAYGEAFHREAMRKMEAGRPGLGSRGIFEVERGGEPHNFGNEKVVTVYRCIVF